MKDEDIREMVDLLIGPDEGERASTFIRLLRLTANRNDDEAWGIASTAMRHAFTKTDAFEMAFTLFAGTGDIAFPTLYEEQNEQHLC